MLCIGLGLNGLSQKSTEKDYHQIPDTYKNHPEYGLLKLEENPNAIELIHLRTKNSRVFTDLVSGQNYSVSTAGTFHFKDENKRWMSVQDKISRTSNSEYGIIQTELPIKINYRTGKTEMVLEKKGNSISFGENSSLQFISNSGSVIENHYSNKSMGEPLVNGNQMVLRDFLPGINRVQETEYWSVRTDYFIEQKLNLPVNTEFLQITDQLNLPSNWKIEYGTGEMTASGWNGDLIIVNGKGNVVSNISRPLYYDSFKSNKKEDVNSHLGLGTYKITKTSTGYTIQLLVPATWLNQENLVYPLVIDPTTTNTYAANYSLYDKTGFNAACQVDMNLNFPPAGGYIVTGTNTSYRIWAKGYVGTISTFWTTTNYFGDMSEQRSRVGSLNGWSAVQIGVGTNSSSTNPSYYTAANNGLTYNLNNITIANGCYENQAIIPYKWQGYQTFFPDPAGPPGGLQGGCSMAYQELVTNTWVVTTTYNVAIVSTTPTTVTYPSPTACKSLTSFIATQTGTAGGAFTSTPVGLTLNASTGEVNPSTSTAGTYTITYSVGTAPCNSQSTASITILNSVTPTFTQIPAICAGGTFTLPTSSTNTAAITGTWSPTIDNTVTTTYTFTPTAGQCANTATMTVTIDPVVAPVISSTSPVCSGATINLTTTATGTYSWTGPNGFTSTVQNPTIPNATTAASGTYSLTLGGACSSPASTLNVIVNPTPAVTVTKTDILCNGNTTGLATATATPAGTYTYAWSPSGGPSSTANNLSAGTYTVTVANGACTTTESVTIAEPTPVSLTTSATESTCGTASGSVSVVASGGSGTYTYLWSPSGATTATVPNLTSGTYGVTVTDGNNCVKTATVNVNSSNGPNMIVTSLTNVSCFGSADGTATISATGGTAPYTYAWSPSGGNSATATGLAPGTYTVAVTDDTGCNSSVNVVITELPLLNLSTSGTNATCGSANGTVSAIATGGTGAYTYTWMPGNLSGATQTNLPTGTYTVSVMDGNGCIIAGSYNVGLTGTIPVNVTPGFTTIDEGQSVNLFAGTSSTIPGITYSWAPPTGLSCIDCPNPIASPTETTTYVVTLTSPDGCTGKDSAVVNVRIICGEYFIPTIFSPNGDGNNDEFRIFGKCIVAMNLKVYNRWGEIVFESTNPQDSWDGTYKGELMNSASFAYSVNLSFIDGRYITEKGTVNLVR